MLQRPLEPTELTPRQQSNYDFQVELQITNERDALIDEIEEELQETGNYPYAQSICGLPKIQFNPEHYDVSDNAMEFLRFCYETPCLPGIATAFMEFAKEKITEPNENWRPEPCM